MIQKQRLLFVTGTRADFGKIEPLAKAAIADGFSVSFFVTGMHMLESYGLTKI
jgi:UDP-N-acetylglucosamine 2-epimerase (hydrolysing)